MDERASLLDLAEGGEDIQGEASVPRGVGGEAQRKAGRGEEGTRLLKSCVLASMFMGIAPGTAGTMTYLQHTGDRPMRIQWRLSDALPADIYRAARVAAG